MKLLQMKTMLGFTALLLLATNAATAQTGSTYNPMADGSWIRYACYYMDAQVNQQTGQLTILDESPQLDSTGSQQYTVVHHSHSMDQRVGNVYQRTETYENPGSRFACDAVYNLQGTAYIGECGNPNVEYTVPFEPEITINPVVGELMDFNAVVYNCYGRPCSFLNLQSVAIPAFHLRYQTVGQNPTWTSSQASGSQVFNDTWLTTLAELTDGWRYQYVHMNGVGLVDFTWGIASGGDAPGEISGFHWVAVAWGNDGVQPSASP